MICKCLNSIDPNNLGDVLNLRDVCYNQRIREVINLVQPYFNTEWMYKFFSFTASLASFETSYRYTLETPIITFNIFWMQYYTPTAVVELLNLFYADNQATH